MRDETYTFIERQRELKSVARCAKYRVNGAHSKKCTLSHERMTPAQLRKENGPVNTYTMNAPHTYKELKAWPDNLRSEYLTKLKTTYAPTYNQLSAMLGVSHNTVVQLLRKAGLTDSSRDHKRRGLQSPEHLVAWLAFTGTSSETHENAPVIEDAPDKVCVPDAPETAQDVPCIQSPRIYTVSVKLSGKPAAIFDRAYHMLDDAEYDITITAVRRGEV